MVNNRILSGALGRSIKSAVVKFSVEIKHLNFFIKTFAFLILVAE